MVSVCFTSCLGFMVSTLAATVVSALRTGTANFFSSVAETGAGGTVKVTVGSELGCTEGTMFLLNSLFHHRLPIPAEPNIAATPKAINCNRQFPFRQVLFDSTALRVERSSASAISKSICPRTGASTSKCCSARVNQCLTARIFNCVLHPGSGTMFTPWDIISAEANFSPRKIWQKSILAATYINITQFSLALHAIAVIFSFLPSSETTYHEPGESPVVATDKNATD